MSILIANDVIQYIVFPLLSELNLTACLSVSKSFNKMVNNEIDRRIETNIITAKTVGTNNLVLTFKKMTWTHDDYIGILATACNESNNEVAILCARRAKNLDAVFYHINAGKVSINIVKNILKNSESDNFDCLEVALKDSCLEGNYKTSQLIIEHIISKYSDLNDYCNRLDYNHIFAAACRSNNLELVTFLMMRINNFVERGYDSGNLYKITFDEIIVEACKGNASNTLMYVLGLAKMVGYSINNYEALRFARARDSVDCMRILLDIEENNNIETFNDCLSRACYYNSHRVIDYVIKRGANLCFNCNNTKHNSNFSEIKQQF